MNIMEVNPIVWGPLQKTDGTLCNPKGNPLKTYAKCMTTIEMKPKGLRGAPLGNKWKPYEIRGYPSKVYGSPLIS